MTPARAPSPTGDEATDEVIDFLVACAGMLNARLIVESGTYAGRTARALAAALPGVVIWTADIAKHEAQDVTGANFFLGDFREMLATLTGEVDLAFIDASDPPRQSCPRLEHMEAVLARMRPGGIVVIDDTATTDWPNVNVIRARGNLVFPLFHGITVVQKAWT